MSLDARRNPIFPFTGRFGGGLLITIIVIALISTGMVVIGPGERGVLMTFGAVGNVLTPGLHFKMPFAQTVAHISVQVQKQASAETASSKDLQVVTTTVAVNFHLDPSKVSAIFRDIGSLTSVANKIIEPAVSNTVKAVTARYNADELIANRDRVRSEMEAQIKEETKKYDVLVDGVNITNFSFSQQYDRAIEDKQVAQQRALKAKYELQQIETESQQQVVQAKAAAEAKVEAAKGNAEATVLAAQAEAKAMSLKAKNITPGILRLNSIQRWDGKLPKVVTGSKGVAPLMEITGALTGRTKSAK